MRGGVWLREKIRDRRGLAVGRATGPGWVLLRGLVGLRIRKGGLLPSLSLVFIKPCLMSAGPTSQHGECGSHWSGWRVPHVILVGPTCQFDGVHCLSIVGPHV